MALAFQHANSGPDSKIESLVRIYQMKRFFMRRILIVAAGLIALTVVILWAAARLINVDRFRPQIEAEFEKRFHRTLRIQAVELRPFPFGVHLHHVEIGEQPRFPSTQRFAKSTDVYVNIGLLSMLRKQPEIKSIRMDQPDIELIKDANGWNFSDLVGKSEGQGKLSLSKLEVDDGQVSITDLTKNEPRATYDHIDLTITDYAPDKALTFALTAHLSGEGKRMLQASGKVGPLASDVASITPFNGRFSLREVSLASARQLGVKSIPEQMDAVASGEADVRTDNGRYSCTGKLRLDKGVVRNVPLGFPVEAEYKLDYDPNRFLLNAQAITLHIGETPFSASGQLDASRAPFQVNMRVNTKEATLAQLARLAAAFGVAFNPNYTVNGTASADLSAQGEVNKPSLAGSLTIRNLEVSGKELKQPVRVPQLALALTPDEIRSQPFQAESGGTHLDGQITVAKYTSPDPSIDGSLKTNGANVAELLSMAKAYGVTAVDGVSGSGNVAVDFRVQGPVLRTSALNYSGSVGLSNVVLNVPSVAKPVEVKTGNVQFQGDAVSVQNLAGSVGSSDLRGNLRLTNFSAPQLEFDLSSNKIDTSEFQFVGSKTQGGFFEKISGSGTLNAGTLIAKPVVLTNLKAKCLLDHGVIQLNPVSSELFDGTQSGSIQADMRAANTSYSLKTKLAGVDVNKLLTATSSQQTLSGTLASDADLKFVQPPGGEIAPTMNGDVTFNVVNGRVKNMNMLNELAKIGKFVNVPAPGASGTDLKKLTGTLHIVNGIANTNDLVAILDSGSLSAKGSINLVNQALDLRMTAILANQLSQSVGGSQIGGYLNTALANKKGEVVIPVIVTGTLANPIFAPDAESMAKMKLENLLPTTGNPASAIEGILGGFRGKQTTPNSGNQTKPEDALKNLLKGLGTENQKKQDQKKQ